VVVEGSLASIFWLKKQGVLPGLTFSNRLIGCNEGARAYLACQSPRRLERRPHQDTVRRITIDATAIKQVFLAGVSPLPTLCIIPCC
jgi:ribonucleoside-diphosphate reductase subunit M2